MKSKGWLYCGIILLVWISAGASLASCDGAGKVKVMNGKPSVYRKPEAEQLKKTLTPEQYRVTQQCGTEPPFNNAYWNNHAPGIYVDVVSGEPLFSSLHKFDSGSGWPSFTQPLETDHITSRNDTSHGMRRTEVRSIISGSEAGG